MTRFYKIITQTPATTLSVIKQFESRAAQHFIDEVARMLCKQSMKDSMLGYNLLQDAAMVVRYQNLVAMTADTTQTVRVGDCTVSICHCEEHYGRYNTKAAKQREIDELTNT